MGRSENQMPAREARLRKLAARIDTLAEKDALLLRDAHETAALRKAAAAELHRICAGFVSGVNRLLARGELSLDPPEFSAAGFNEDGINMIQISVRGRVLQLQFEATGELLSTEDFRVPYTLEGSARAFNQELLAKELIEEQLIFYTVEKGRNLWRFFDARTYRSGPLDQEYLIGLMEQLI